jgi:hypothetical protein
MSCENGAKRVLRLAIGALLPVPIALLLFQWAEVIARPGPGALVGLLAMLPVVYIAAGLQSLIYSLLMEFCVWRLVGVNLAGIATGGLLGALCGLSFFHGMFHEIWLRFVWYGLITGLATSSVLYTIRKSAIIPGISPDENDSNANEADGSAQWSR